jgi:prevent-host-death family protein
MSNDMKVCEEVGSYDAKTKLPEILRKVAKGSHFTITNRGKPVADLVPSKASSQLKAKTAIKNLLKARKHKVSDADLNEMKTSGRR